MLQMWKFIARKSSEKEKGDERMIVSHFGTFSNEKRSLQWLPHSSHLVHPLLMSVCLSVCLSRHLFPILYLVVCLDICLSISLCGFRFSLLSMCLFVCVPIGFRDGIVHTYVYWMYIFLIVLC